MAQFIKHFVQDLQQDIKIRQCGTIVFNADNLSNVISVELYNGTEPYSGGGSVAGACICPDGSTVPLTGSIDGKTASVTLTGDCFAFPGQIGIGVQVVSGTIKTTVLKAIYNVELFETDDVIDPGSRITASVGQLVADIEAATAEIPASDMASLMSGIAPTFNASTNYAAGAYVYYNGTLYQFITAHAVGSWTGTDATAVALGNDVADLKSAVKTFTGNEQIAYTVTNGYYTTSTVGTTVDFNAPTSSSNFDAAVVECVPGDVFTVSGTTGASGRIWAFLDADKKVTRRETSNDYIDNKVITAQTGEVWLVINNRKASTPDAVSYRGEVLVNAVKRLDVTAMTNKTITGTTFAQNLEMGVYGLSKAQMESMSDAPLDVDDAVGTLINYAGAYLNGIYVIQRLYQLSGKAWERLVNSSDGTINVAWKRIGESVGNVLHGKKLVTAGDSYTQAYWDGDYAEYNGKNFGYYIAQRNQMTFVNSGISGSTMAVPPGGAGNKNPFVIDRYTAVPADTDYLTIWFGINDAANCDLGSITDGDDGTPVNNTIYGAWNIVLKYYLTNRPWMKVLIIVPSMPSSESANNVRNAIRAVAKKWGYPYLDWQMDYSIPAFFDKREGMSDEAVALRRDAFGYNGPNQGHPNPQWYEYESTIIEAKLRSI